MVILTDNPVMDAEMYFAEQERELQQLPKCVCCGNPIQDETAVCINDELICHGCIESYYTVHVDDYT